MAHVDDRGSLSELADTLTDMQSAAYEFAIERWGPGTVLEPPRTRGASHIVIEAERSQVTVSPGDGFEATHPSKATRRATGFSRRPPESTK